MGVFNADSSSVLGARVTDFQHEAWLLWFTFLRGFLQNLQRNVGILSRPNRDEISTYFHNSASLQTHDSSVIKPNRQKGGPNLSTSLFDFAASQFTHILCIYSNGILLAAFWSFGSSNPQILKHLAPKTKGRDSVVIPVPAHQTVRHQYQDTIIFST